MTRPTAVSIERVERLAAIPSAEWNHLARDDPFLSHEFLNALESSGCVGSGTAWQPAHLAARDSTGTLVAAMPLYIKTDSRGEFVFDWGWAEAYERAGRRYYPKLVSAVPFTPATGPRLLLRGDAPDGEAAVSRLLDAARSLALDAGASSIHVLFPRSEDCTTLADAHYLSRKGCQFHWRNQSYADFENFLAQFTSEKRKKARRERRRIREAKITFEHLHADELSVADWDAVFGFYARTFLLRGRRPYLNRAFFDMVAQSMPRRVIVVVARFDAKPIAAAICFRSSTRFYGRYWGSLAEFHSLHFETCYYQGIDYCIREGLEVFEPGTQGEHKISRGFSPTPTWSYHEIFDLEFRTAVGEFLHRETHFVDEYIDECTEHVPYRKDHI